MIVQVKLTYDVIPIPLVISIMVAILYYILGSWVIYINFKNVYQLLFEKKKLIEETRRIIDVFPEGVIIHSKIQQNLSEDYYSNNVFAKSIANFQDQISHLSEVDIRYRDSVENSINAS
jgi:hypothetical protein